MAVVVVKLETPFGRAEGRDWKLDGFLMVGFEVFSWIFCS